MKIPTTLKHKPVVVSENYESIDGRQAGKSDAKGLSLGLAQWNDRGRVDISAKVWRYTGKNGPASQRSSHSTEWSIWQSWFAGPNSILQMLIGIPNSMMKPIPGSIESDCRGMR